MVGTICRKIWKTTQHLEIAHQPMGETYKCVHSDMIENQGNTWSIWYLIMGQWLDGLPCNRLKKFFYLPPGTPPGCQWVSSNLIREASGVGLSWERGTATNRASGHMESWPFPPVAPPCAAVAQHLHYCKVINGSQSNHWIEILIFEDTVNSHWSCRVWIGWRGLCP